MFQKCCYPNVFGAWLVCRSRLTRCHGSTLARPARDRATTRGLAGRRGGPASIPPRRAGEHPDAEEIARRDKAHDPDFVR